MSVFIINGPKYPKIKPSSSAHEHGQTSKNVSKVNGLKISSQLAISKYSAQLVSSTHVSTSIGHPPEMLFQSSPPFSSP